MHQVVRRLGGVAVVAALLAGPATRAAVVNFEDLALPADSVVTGDSSQMPFESGGVVFNRTWSTEFDCCPGAWAYSNQTDLTTAGFSNPYSAYVLPGGGGVDGSANFAVANNRVQGEALVALPRPSRILGAYVANTTYTYLAVVEGNDGAGFVKGPFNTDDWLRLDFVGLDESGQEIGVVDFYLADYRDGQRAATSEWTWVDLSALGDRVQQLEFRMESTDMGPFGMNTPAYFAIDNLTYQVVPEPALGCWLAGALALLLIKARGSVGGSALLR